MKQIKTIFLGITALSAIACSPEAEETSAGSAPLVMKAKLDGGVQTAPSFSPAGENISFGKDITVTSVKVVLANINLYGRKGYENEDGDMHGDDDMKGDDKKDNKFAMSTTSTVKTGNQVKFSGPYVLDLTSGTFTPSLAAVTIPVGHYKKLDMTFQTLSAAEAAEMSLSVSDPVIGHSFVIEGWLNHVTIGTAVTDETLKFRIIGNQDESFKVNLKKGFDVRSGTLNDLLLVFNATGWFPANIIGQLRSELSESSIVTNAVTGERVLVIDASQGTASQFKQLFRKSIRIAHDFNHDMMVAADEEGDSVEE